MSENAAHSSSSSAKRMLYKALPRRDPAGGDDDGPLQAARIAPSIAGERATRPDGGANNRPGQGTHQQIRHRRRNGPGAG